MRTADGPPHTGRDDPAPGPLSRQSWVFLLAVAAACALAIILAMARGELPAAQIDPVVEADE